MNSFFREHFPLLVFLTIIFILGIAFGAVAIKTVEYQVKENLLTYFNSFLKGLGGLEYDQKTLFTGSIKFNLISILVIWFFGLTFLLLPFIIVILFFKGFVLGFTVGFLISEYAFKGILIALVTIFPQNIIIIPVYIYSSTLAVVFAFRILQFYRGRRRLISSDFFNYSLEMLPLALLLAVASLLEAYISPLLFKWIIRFI